MLKYKFNSYYSNSNCSVNLFMGIYRNKYRRFVNEVKLNHIYYQRVNIVNILEVLIESRDSLKIINILNKNASNFDSDNIHMEQLHVLIANKMFLMEIKKNNQLLKKGFHLGLEDSILDVVKLNINQTMDHPKLQCDDINIFNKQMGGINQEYNRFYIYIEDGYEIADNPELIYAYMKCAIIALMKTYIYEEVLININRRVNKFNVHSDWINSVVKTLRLPESYFLKCNTFIYSKKKIEENIILNITNGCFISRFNTYSNLKSTNEDNTLIAVMQEKRVDNIVDYKIIISNKILNYFAFLKANQKKELYSNDYKKLNKSLNIIKSIASAQDIEIEFNDIEKDIYSTEITVNSSNVVKFLNPSTKLIIPKNIEQAICIKNLFNELTEYQSTLSSFTDEIPF